MAGKESAKTSKKSTPRKSTKRATTRKAPQPGDDTEWKFPLNTIVGHESIKRALRRYLIHGRGEFKSALLWSEGELGGLELAEAVGAEMGARILHVDCPVLWGSDYVELFDAEVSRAERWLREGETVIMIFNDFEYIAHSEDVNYYAPRTLFRFLSSLKSRNYTGLYVIAITTDIGSINGNIYRRFDLHLELEPYDENELQTLIINHLGADDSIMSREDLSWLSGKILGFDLLALKNIIKRAKQEALHRQGAGAGAFQGVVAEGEGGMEKSHDSGKKSTGRKRGNGPTGNKKPVITRSDLETALKSSRESLPFVVTAELISETRFEDVIGPASRKLSEIIELYFDDLDVVRRHNIKPLNGILLHGPPGTGKTSLAKAVAHHIKGAFFNVSIAEIASKWFGEFEKNISRTFNTARAIAKKRNYPSVLFFDELDSWSSRTDSDVMNRALSVLLTELDGLTSDHNVLAIAATNRHSKLEKGLIRPGRFDMQIEVKLPDPGERDRIFRKYLDDTPVKGVNFKKLSAMTKGLSGAEIENIVALAKIEKILQFKKGGKGAEMEGEKEGKNKGGKGVEKKGEKVGKNKGGKGVEKKGEKVGKNKGGKGVEKNAKSGRGKRVTGKRDEEEGEPLLELNMDDLISVMVNEKNYYVKLSRNPMFRTLNKKKYTRGKRSIKMKDVDSLYV